MKKLFALLCLCLWYGGAYAQFDPTHTYQIRNLHSLLLLDVTGGSYANGAPVQQYADNGTSAQQWQFQPAYSSPGNSFYYITNRGSGKALELDGSNANGTGIVQNTKRQVLSQIWQIIPSPNGNGWVLRSPEPFSTVLRNMEVENAGMGNGDRVQIWDNANQDHQEWQIEDVTYRYQQPAAFRQGVFYLSNVYSGKYLEVNNATSTTGEPVRQWAATGQTHQQWYFEQPDFGVSPDYYRIINRNSGMALEIENDSPFNGALAQQNTPFGGSGQQWRLVPYNNANDYIIQNINGKVLEIDGSSTANGARAQQWDRDIMAPGQVWRLVYLSVSRAASSAPTAALVIPQRVENKLPAGLERLQVYPTPARARLTVSLGGRVPAAVTVFDAQGRPVPAPYLGDGQVDVSGLTAGLYLLSVHDGHRELRHKFIKE